MSIKDFEDEIGKLFAENTVPCHTMQISAKGIASCLVAVEEGNGSEFQQTVVAQVFKLMAAELAQLKSVRADADCCGNYCCVHCAVCHPGEVVGEVESD